MSRPPLALLSMAAMAMGGQLSGLGAPIQIRKEEDWDFPDDVGWKSRRTEKSGPPKSPKSKAVQKRRAKNKVATASRKRGRA